MQCDETETYFRTCKVASGVGTTRSQWQQFFAVLTGRVFEFTILSESQIDKISSCTTVNDRSIEPVSVAVQLDAAKSFIDL